MPKNAMYMKGSKPIKKSDTVSQPPLTQPIVKKDQGTAALTWTPTKSIPPPVTYGYAKQFMDDQGMLVKSKPKKGD